MRKNSLFSRRAFDIFKKVCYNEKENARRREKVEHSGHRQRLLKRFNEEILPEQEQLEILLFNAMPRRNTNDLAHRLLARFGSMEGVLSSSMTKLKEVEGVGDSLASYLRVIGIYLEKGLRSATKRIDGALATEEFIESVRPIYERLKTETVTAYLIDKTGKVVREYTFSEDRKTLVRFSTHEFVWLLQDARPSGVFLVHNHPDGKVEPSKTDDEATKRCQSICFAYGVAFYDHVIFVGDSYYSYYLSGRLPLDDEESVNE